ncbi:MAG TPA: hypothetical protein PLU43_10915 [Lachnospiraceae bacterium]|nr:hypothetical protein [Lachnospiraceae bacterium]
MKLKLYLRGLGIGVIVTALLMGFSGSGKQTLTDDEIIAKAKALGMVQEDQVLLSPEAENSDADVESADSAISSAQAVEEINTAEAEPSEEEADAADTEQSEEEADAVDTEQSEDQAEGEPYVIEIAKGSSSDTVSALLQKGGLISDAADFDSYLCRYGYDHRIVSGKHEIPSGADYETIAKLITTR